GTRTHDRVAQVLLPAVSARDVPSAPALSKRTLVIRDQRRGFQRVTGGIRQHRKHEETWNGRARLESVMAYQTVFFLRFQHGMRVVLLIELVKDGARFGIHGSDFNELAMVDPPNVDVVVEINGPRHVRSDL